MGFLNRSNSLFKNHGTEADVFARVLSLSLLQILEVATQTLNIYSNSFTVWLCVCCDNTKNIENTDCRILDGKDLGLT